MTENSNGASDVNRQQYERAIAAIDAAHTEDPTIIVVNGEPIPYELHYAQKMTTYLDQRLPQASDTVRLAIRAQHFRRWESPRSAYPMTRAGYLTWRSRLKTLQAKQVEALLQELDYSTADCERVASLIRKENLKSDEETQALEDVACLVFLDDQFEEFEKSHDEEKILGILRKTWAKMSNEGRQMALNMKMEGRPSELIQKALVNA